MHTFLTMEPPDLTLARKKYGKFPFRQSDRVVEGREKVTAAARFCSQAVGDDSGSRSQVESLG